MKSIHLLLMAISAAFTAPTYALFDEVHFNGSNTLRFEHYNASGDVNRSPYQNEGLQTFNEFNLSGRYKSGKFESWQGQISGVLNDSYYRARENGLRVERFNLKREKGDGIMPHRVEAGDYLAFFSQRTIQRSLKGLQLELQPRKQSKQHQSILLFLGANQANWQALDFNEDRSAGISWLLDFDRKTRASLNLFQNHRAENTASNQAERNQRIASIALEHNWAIKTHSLKFESELAGFSGDNNAQQAQDDYGYMMQLSGKNAESPLHWRLRHERYGEDYQPNGAAISPNRRSLEAHIGWRDKQGMNIRGRLQHYRNALESDNPTDTTTLGGSFSGKLFDDINANLSGFHQRVRSQDQQSRQNTDSISANLSKNIQGWVSSLGYSGQFRTNLNDATNDSESHQFSLRANAPISKLGLNTYGWQGQMSLGVTRRHNSGNSSSRDFSPTLGLNLRRNKHQLSANYSLNSNHPESSEDTDNHRLNLAYRYRSGQNTFGAEINRNLRSPEDSEETDAYKVSLFWQYQFDRPPRSQRRASPTSGAAPLTEVIGGRADIANFQPGLDFAELQASLGSSQTGTRLGRFRIYETVLLPQIDQRQRLVLEQDIDTLARSALIIDFADTGNLEDIEQTFRRTLDVLVARYGSPDDFIEEGNFSADIARKINDESLQRLYEWRLPNSMLRFGIPRRLDESIRMELQHAKRFGAISDTLWSIEEVQ